MGGRRRQQVARHRDQRRRTWPCDRDHDGQGLDGQRPRDLPRWLPFLLADTAFAFACNTHGAAVVASGADVAFLAPVRSGDRLEATAVERVLRGRSGLYDVSVRRGREVVLEFRGRSRAMPPRPQREPQHQEHLS